MSKIKIRKPSRRVTGQGRVADDDELRRIGKMVVNSNGWGGVSLPSSLGWTFLRGMFFGFGTFFGGTIVAAIAVWFFAQIGEVPFLGELIMSMQDSFEATR